MQKIHTPLHTPADGAANTSRRDGQIPETRGERKKKGDNNKKSASK